MIYDKMERHYKKLMVLPLIALAISLVIIGHSIATTGSFMQRDIELAGGKMITVQVGNNIDVNAIREALPYATVHLTSGTTKSLLLEIPFDKNETETINTLRSVANFSGTPTIEIVGPALGNLFFQQAQLALVLAFVFMAIVVFILFRSLVPSSIVLLCAATDIIVTIAVLNVLGVSLSLPVLVALLTIIGYSVDTDILLTSELLKSGTHNMHDSIKSAMKTGITMSCTAITALVALYFISGSIVLETIAFALIIGLVVDMPATWLTNTGILRKWLEKKWAA